MGIIGRVKKAATDAGRFLSTTGRGALRKIGDTAGSIKSFAGKVNEATGGAAGTAWEASKSMPVVGAVTTNIEKGLNLGERATKIRSVGDAKGVYGDARSLYKDARG